MATLNKPKAFHVKVDLTKCAFTDPVSNSEGGLEKGEWAPPLEWNDGGEKTKVLQPSLSLIHYAPFPPFAIPLFAIPTAAAVRALVEISPG